MPFLNLCRGSCCRYQFRRLPASTAYRDEGTSYHNTPDADYITVKNAAVVASFMEEAGLPFITGKTRTTDAFYRETRGNFEKRKQEGQIISHTPTVSVVFF